MPERDSWEVVKLEISFKFYLRDPFFFLRDPLVKRMEMHWKGQWKTGRPLRETIAQVVQVIDDGEFERHSGGIGAIYKLDLGNNAKMRS